MTPVDIVNIGIEALGERPISSFEEGSVAAIGARATFHAALRAVLEKAHWIDATGRALLAAEVTKPAFDYAFQYVLPADFLKVRKISGYTWPWERAGRRLLTNVPAPVKLLYTRDMGVNAAGQAVSWGDDIPIGGLLASAVAHRWATWNAKRITGSESAAQEMERKFGLAFVEAVAADAAEGTVDPQSVGSWVSGDAPDAWAVA